MNKKQQDQFLAWYKNRYKCDDVIEKTSMMMLWITEEEDVAERKHFLRELLWKEYDKKIHTKRLEWKYWEKVFNDLYFNYWPKWTYEISVGP